TERRRGDPRGLEQDLDPATLAAVRLPATEHPPARPAWVPGGGPPHPAAGARAWRAKPAARMGGGCHPPTEIASGSPSAIRHTSPVVHGPTPGSFSRNALASVGVASRSAAIFFGCRATSRSVAARRWTPPIFVSSHEGIDASRSGSGGR